MPDMLTFLCERGKERELASLSEIKDAEEAQSRRALASTADPSGATTETRHVINSEAETTLEAMLDDTVTTGSVLDVSAISPFSTCNNV